jgi:hypothetical protein
VLAPFADGEDRARSKVKQTVREAAEERAGEGAETARAADDHICLPLCRFERDDVCSLAVASVHDELDVVSLVPE